MKYVRTSIVVGMIFTLLQSCVSAQLPEATMWNGISVELAKSPGAIIKQATIDGNELTGLIITGSLEITKPRISGGGHMDLILLANNSEVVVASGNHISSRRGNVRKRTIPFEVAGESLLTESGVFLLKFHRGNPRQHSKQMG